LNKLVLRRQVNFNLTKRRSTLLKTSVIKAEHATSKVLDARCAR
jgi:hypothetical protein